MFNIGNITLSSPVILAPMAGISDLPTRQLCQDFGIAMSVAEMVHANTGLWDSQKSSNRLLFDGITGPKTIQLVGNHPEQLADAAQQAEKMGVDIVDINMGCPAKKVCKKAAGSALLQDERLVAEILQTVVSATSLPVTLKTRTGFSHEQRNASKIAKLAENSGIQAITIHGRTRADRFLGQAEYDTIAAVKQAVNIPVIANGDIDSPLKAKQVLDYTGADAVMVGRAIQGQPWILQEIVQFLASGDIVTPLSQNDRKTLLLRHLIALHQFYGEHMGVRIARKHIGAFFDLQQHTTWRKRFNTIDNNNAQIEFLHQYFDQLSYGDKAA